MATIRKREGKSGRITWEVQVRRRGAPSLTATFPSRREAREWASREEARIRLDRRFPEQEARRHTLAEACARYEAQVLPRLAESSRQTMAGHLRAWRRMLGGYTLDAVTPAMLADARQALLDSGVSNSTANHYLVTLSGLFTTAAREWQWTVANPCRALVRLPEPRGRLRYLDAGELDRLLAAARASSCPLLAPAVILSLATGGRRGEVLGLLWRDVDFDRGQVLFRDTKNREPRAVPISASAREVLLELRASAPVVGPDVLVFGSPRTGKPLDLRWPFRAALRAAGVRDFRWHDLRHTAASYLAMAGVPIRTIAEIVGHRTLQMTMRYAHLSPDHLASAVADLDRGLFGK